MGLLLFACSSESTTATATATRSSVTTTSAADAGVVRSPAEIVGQSAHAVPLGGGIVGLRESDLDALCVADEIKERLVWIEPTFSKGANKSHWTIEQGWLWDGKDISNRTAVVMIEATGADPTAEAKLRALLDRPGVRYPEVCGMGSTPQTHVVMIVALAQLTADRFALFGGSNLGGSFYQANARTLEEARQKAGAAAWRENVDRLGTWRVGGMTSEWFVALGGK